MGNVLGVVAQIRVHGEGELMAMVRRELEARAVGRAQAQLRAPVQEVEMGILRLEIANPL